MSGQDFARVVALGEEYLIIRTVGDTYVFTDSFLNSLGRFEEALLAGLPMPPIESEASLESYVCSMAIIFHMAKYNLQPDTVHVSNANKLTNLVRSIYRIQGRMGNSS